MELPGYVDISIGKERVRSSEIRPSVVRWRQALLAMALAFAGCDGPQSTLSPAGRDAERIAELFYWMASGAVLVWIAVIGLAVYTIRVRPREHDDRRAKLLIIGGGAVVPTIVLAVLLVYGLSMMPDLRQASGDGLVIEVSGERWWWRVRYVPPEGRPVELANEIRLPVGEKVEFRLTSPDVVHSFWIPSLGGKMDMIPGRMTRLILEPTRTGVFRGACAEYCGASHALMAFDVVILEKEEFRSWLEHQRAPAAAPAEPLAQRGQALFLESGCGACHTVRGTEADGDVGPDLTHVGSRSSLAAGTLPNEPASFERWIAFPKVVKPEVQMPHFGMLPEEEISAVAAYLESLE